MNIKDLVLNADEFSINEIREFSPDIEMLYYIAMNNGIKLAEKLKANIDIVRIGISLMDCKLPKAQKDGIPEKHVEMSAIATKEMLKDYDLDDETKKMIINCVETHHGTKEYLSIEAEIVANADCYKFVHPKGVFAYASLLGRRLNNLDKELEQIEYKLDEKYNTLSLEIAKDELEEYYKQFKNMIKISRKEDN